MFVALSGCCLIVVTVALGMLEAIVHAYTKKRSSRDECFSDWISDVKTVQ